MHEAVNKILKMIGEEESKKKALDALAADIEMARGILSGDFKYCPDCDDYYLARSFITDIDRKETEICVYRDPINSGGDEYDIGYIDTTYRTCPKGHRTLIEVRERKKR